MKQRDPRAAERSELEEQYPNICRWLIEEVLTKLNGANIVLYKAGYDLAIEYIDANGISRRDYIRWALLFEYNLPNDHAFKLNKQTEATLQEYFENQIA